MANSKPAWKHGETALSTKGVKAVEYVRNASQLEGVTIPRGSRMLALATIMAHIAKGKR